MNIKQDNTLYTLMGEQLKLYTVSLYVNSIPCVTFTQPRQQTPYSIHEYTNFLAGPNSSIQYMFHWI